MLAELTAHREALLQACWAHQLWSATALRTTGDLPLKVLFPGWLNRGAGPDFTEARIAIGDAEHFGDVEIHLDESGWERHGHHLDANYGRVILHVVLERSERVSAKGGDQRPVPVFHVAPFLGERVRETMGDPEAMLERYANLPGRCGLTAGLQGGEALASVISHAAEVRARHKAERIRPLWEKQDEEQILFELIFQSLGYRPHAEPFRALASRFPLRSLHPLLERPYPDARDALLSRWFGAGGLLEAERIDSGPAEFDAEYRRWRDEWRGLKLRVQDQPLQHRGSRPWNSPERRLVGLFHHLYAFHSTGWLKGWLEFLVELDGLRNSEHLRRAAIERMERIFDTPPSEAWRWRVSFQSAPLKTAARMIGNDRMIVIMANAVIPFFLAYARRRRDRELEKLLYRLFIVLPPEAPNRKTRFMEKRLVLLSRLPRTLRTQQGLLQIYQDYCTSFESGCHGCKFPGLIAASAKAGKLEI